MKEIEKKARLQHLVELIKYSPVLSDEVLEPYMEELLLLSPDP